MPAFAAVALGVMATPVTLGASFDAGIPVPLFAANVRLNHRHREYCVTRDGKRFLVNRVVAEEAPSPMTFIQNWTTTIGK